MPVICRLQIQSNRWQLAFLLENFSMKEQWDEKRSNFSSCKAEKEVGGFEKVTGAHENKNAQFSSLVIVKSNDLFLKFIKLELTWD